jgi:hypothetical protein
MSHPKGKKAKAARYPVGTVALYGPDDKVTTKIVAVAPTRRGWTSPSAATARSATSGRANRGAGDGSEAARNISG